MNLPICESCNQPKRPGSLLWGQRPGWACECQYSTLTPREFVKMFGFPWKKSLFTHSGSSHDRRKTRRLLARSRVTVGGDPPAVPTGEELQRKRKVERG